MEREPADGCDPSTLCTKTRADGTEGIILPKSSLNDTVRANNRDSFSEDLSSLRCSSLQIEEVQKRRRNRQPSAGYPGLAFGGPMYSNTLFKFFFIANELKDLKQNQLRKVSFEQCVFVANNAAIVGWNGQQHTMWLSSFVSKRICQSCLAILFINSPPEPSDQARE